MKYIILMVLMFSFNSIESGRSGVITYKKEVVTGFSEKNREKKNENHFSKISKEIDGSVNNILKELEFELFYKDNESIFKVKKYLELEGNRFYGFALGPYGNAVYYNNSNYKINIKQLEAYGEMFLIKENPIEWKTTVHTKKIGAYTCYKAITIKEVKGRNGMIEYPVTAWFCPELPFSFGPLGYAGLPGLILELEINNEKYTATKIELNPKREVKVEKPKKGKEVTKEEFEEIGLKTMNSFRKTIGK
ncbi:GLPGLI family protein [Urechidicola croceus]|uniref:GLPGLI family protein n=1 Tax=Urechidicola croceus TaxID=1850246 RepID=A0A1D8PBU7_9FLAO|nr:GLPGLI family protein [Urechidicola croceus]AOW22062.1 hypothetical protein LPB138_08930 [Urechidicola croceus]